MAKEDLKTNKTDITVSIGKSVFGAVPFAGAFLSEIVSTVIPNQRIDRLTKYIEILEQKLNNIPEKIYEGLKSNELFIDLIEESFVQASRALTKDRMEYIASVIANGISAESIKFEESKFLFKILQELNDIEIIWLRYYFGIYNGDKEFQERHEAILSPLPVYIGSSKEEVNKAAIQESYKGHLERLNLVKYKYRVDRKTGLPEFDKNTGVPKKSFTDITPLGKLLINQIGLNDIDK